MIDYRIIPIEGKGRVLLPVRCAGRSESYSSNDLKKVLNNDKRSLLITGETGTGKDMLMDYVEQRTKRQNVRCQRINGSDTDSQGLLRACESGVLFLDDICSLSTDLQVRLARFMKDGKKRFDVRIIAETNKDVNDDMVMIPDLRARFDCEVKLPPLKERAGDILWLLCEPEFLGSEVFSGVTLRTLVGILMADWAGNISELKKYCQQKEILRPVSLTDVRRYVCDDTNIFHRWSEPVTSFAGYALLAFESYARKSAGGVPPRAARAAALFAGLFHGMQGMLRRGDENVAVLPLAKLSDLINGMLLERADFDLDFALFDSVASYDEKMAALLDELNINGLGCQKMDFAAALNRIVHVAFDADIELCARGGVDFSERIPITFCNAYRDPNAVMPKGEVLFEMPKPPKSDCGQVSVFDELGAGKSDRGIDASCDKGLSDAGGGAEGIPKWGGLGSGLDKKATGQPSAPHANRSSGDSKVIGDYKVAPGGPWIGELLAFRWARALAYGHTGATVEWKTLFPDLPEGMWERYFEKVRVTVCERRDFGKGEHFLTPASWQSKYEAFAKAVLVQEKAPKLEALEPIADIQFMRVDYGRFFEDIAESANMISDVVALGHLFWKIGQVRVARRMDTHPVVRFVGKLDEESRSALAVCAAGKYPGGVLVPSKEELADTDFKWFKKYGLAVFGIVEDCRVNDKGVFEVRDSKTWVTALEPQIHPGELRQARSVGNTYRAFAEEVKRPICYSADSVPLNAPRNEADLMTDLTNVPGKEENTDGVMPTSPIGKEVCGVCGWCHDGNDDLTVWRDPADQEGKSSLTSKSKTYRHEFLVRLHEKMAAGAPDVDTSSVLEVIKCKASDVKSVLGTDLYGTLYISTKRGRGRIRKPGEKN